MQKNTASQKVALLAIDVSTNAPKTGDAANLTAYVSKDWGAVTVLADTTATELDATNAPGIYLFDLAQAETNADELILSGKSSTANIKLIPRIIQTVPASFSTLTIANNCVDADLERCAGTAITSSGGRPEVNMTHAAGTAWGSGAITAASIAADAITAAKVADGTIDAATFAAGAINAAAIAADAITDAKVASDVTIASVTGAVGSVTGNVGGNVVGSVGSVTGAVGSVTGNVGGSVASVATGGITRASFAADTGLQSVRSNTAQAGAAGTITLDASASATDDIYNDHLAYITGGTGVGQMRFITDYVGATKIATVKPNWTTNPDNTSTFAIVPAASVWDQVTADHVDTGSTGASLNAAGSAGDPWTTALPGAYGSGTAGKIVGDSLDAAVSSRQATIWSSAGATVNLSATTIKTLTDAPADSSGITTLLSRIPSGIFTGMTSLAQWLGLLGGKQTGNATALTEIKATGAGSGTYDPTTDSQEALRDNTGTAGAGLTAADDAVIAAIAALNNISTAQVNAEVDTALSDWGKTGFSLVSAYDFAKGTVAMTESYAADGAAPTPVQSLMLIQQCLTDVSISGTTMTIKKLDGSTTAATLTLNDGTTPTAKTRAS